MPDTGGKVVKMKDEIFEKENELLSEEIEAREEITELPETDELDEIDILTEDRDAEQILDEVGEGLLVEDEIDELELDGVIEVEDVEDEEAEPLISADENIEEPKTITNLIESKKYAELKSLLEETPSVDIAELFSEVESRYHAVLLRLLSLAE